MQNNEKKKVLLKISNLKQYFPVGKRGLYVKANDGVTLDIYEGETLGLVGESGCGKSTFGRTILQLYRQTDGRTMYYGSSLDELAPKYVRVTYSKLPKLIRKQKKLHEKYEHLKAEYDAADEKEQMRLHTNMENARKADNDAYLNIVNLVGGFYSVDDLKPCMELFKERFRACTKLHSSIEARRPTKLDYDEAEFAADKEDANDAKREKKQKLAEKLKEMDRVIEGNRKELAQIDAKLDALRSQYKSDSEFQKHEALRDDGIDLARLTYPECRLLRSQMQYIFQDPYSSLNPRMTIGQIISEGLVAHKYFKKNGERMNDEVLKVMNECGLADYFVHRFPHQFSGGQRQRICIARSLAVRPKFVVCDEAVSALDVSIQSQILNLLRDLKQDQKLTYLFITHDLSVVKYISDRIGVMYLGNMVELASSESMFRHPYHPYTEALLNAIPTTEEKKDLIVLEGDIPSPVNPPKGCKFHTRCKYCTEICEQVVPDWEEVEPDHFVACHHKLEKLNAGA
ncbi:MAG: ATP-binding cassette domain-containing protein [Oscillospiraceae bacterium]|nr:ATP-binding cassette domain-containing protein [Oscillospiraceae bacterium]